MKRFSISDIESLIGIKAHTIRAWEARYNLVPPKRTPTNIRYYEEDDLKHLLNIVTLNEKGYKISRIAKMDKAQINDLVLQLQADYNNDTVQVLRLSDAALKYDETAFSEILSGCIEELGLIDTMDLVLFPFMKKVGMLWQTGAIDPSHEHFASNLIRDRMIVEIDKLSKPDRKDPKRFLLFLPEAEMHETGLLFARYLLKRCGMDTLYLGQEIPYTDIKKVIAHYKPDYAFIVLTSLNLGKDINKILTKVLDHMDVPLLVAGSLISEFDILLDDRLTPLKKVCEIVEFLDDL
ncbi:DNA-binding transcriptional MerR regulator [Pedobacter cryoconitis]|uniref:DNA-binding transcriptional MerR regulator n=1 Tax=Pedobacter cryoconitis TaxID=188932 RepID=A0A7W8YY33_9SPHI|nr:MerR family transcriptional regulator [Pedobacter cryoconitis]MBB5623954.1 DNA-binding transcriptional MerR regulator [Pedobacter cryoconitis]MBB5647331.1 DNA-binding transcriptional MerR regulator [Pedobacter cryoconitis]